MHYYKVGVGRRIPYSLAEVLGLSERAYRDYETGALTLAA